MVQINVEGLHLLREAMLEVEPKYRAAVRRAVQQQTWSDPKMNPDREAKRLAAAQEAATAQAKAGKAHLQADMVAVFSVAGFELAEIFAEWSRRWEHAVVKSAHTYDEMLAADQKLDRFDIWARQAAGGLGPTYEIEGETPEAFGQRIARGVLKLIKEV